MRIFGWPNYRERFKKNKGSQLFELQKMNFNNENELLVVISLTTRQS